MRRSRRRLPESSPSVTRIWARWCKRAPHSSTQAMPIVKLSQDDLFRLVIPVPESYVRYIHIGDPVDVRVPSLNKTFPGKVARFSVDVKEATRTMHTEVDVQNRDRVLMPGLYADADVALEHRDDVPTIPLQAVNHEGQQDHSFCGGQEQ